MLVVDLHLERLEEIPVAALFGAVGIYTIWAHGATDRPTYVGEGVILERLAQHVKTWGKHITGACAILSDTGSGREDGKKLGTVAEAFILELGELLNRRPRQNSAPGHTQRLREVVEMEGKIRLNVRGLHPYTHPLELRTRLVERAECSVELDDDGEFLFTTPWNVRAKRR